MFYRILQDFIRKSRGTSVLTDTRIVTEPIQSPCYTRPTTNQLPSNELKNPTGNHSGRAVNSTRSYNGGLRAYLLLFFLFWSNERRILLLDQLVECRYILL